MPGRASTRSRCTCARRAQRDRHVDALLGAGLEQQRDLQHRELRARILLLDQEIDLGRNHHRMHDGFELFEPALGEPASFSLSSLRSTLPPRVDAGKGRLDRPDRLAFIEAMHASIGVEHRHAAAREMLGRRRLPHADAAGEADDQHHAAPSEAATWAFSAGVTSGRTPNQLSKPGTA